MQQNKTNIVTLLTLFMVIILDIMGIILVFPVLTPLILQTSSSILPADTPLVWRDFLYGFILALFPLFMFFSTPVLGDLSDKFGRKKILLICLIGSAASYFVSAYGIAVNSIFLLAAGRAIAGLAAGTQPIASAAIIDISTPETKTKHLSWIVLACSVGLVLGPLLGGLTAEKNIAAGFGYQTPFIVAGSLSLINAVFLFFTYKETFVLQAKQKLYLLKGFILFLTAFSNSKFRLISFAFFCMLLAWSLYFQGIGWFFMQNFQYGVGKLGLFNGYIGVVFVLAITIVGRVALKWFSRDINAFLFFVFLMMIANLGSALSQGELPQWLWVILNATCDSICYTVALTLFSGLADDESQGWIMGVVGAINAVTWTVGGMIIGPLGYMNIYVPFWAAAFLSLLSFVMMIIYRRLHK